MSSARGVFLCCCAGLLIFQLPRCVPANPLKPGIASAAPALASIAVQAVVFMLEIDVNA
jgi:hypothetical protein